MNGIIIIGLFATCVAVGVSLLAATDTNVIVGWFFIIVACAFAIIIVRKVYLNRIRRNNKETYYTPIVLDAASIRDQLKATDPKFFDLTPGLSGNIADREKKYLDDVKELLELGLGLDVARAIEFRATYRNQIKYENDYQNDDE